MENLNANLKNLSKNKIYLIIIGLAAIIFATVLIYAYVDFSGTKINKIRVLTEEAKPYCGAIGSKSEGWYIDSDSDRPELIRWDNCKGCSAVRKSNGWYSSCDGQLIKPISPVGKCADTDGGINEYEKGTACVNSSFCKTDMCDMILYSQSTSTNLEKKESNITPSSLGDTISTDIKKDHKAPSLPPYYKDFPPIEPPIPTNPISADAPLVLEYYCENGKIMSKHIHCENGCRDGACLRVEIPPIPRQPYCDAIGTRSEGWYQNGKRIIFEQCDGCVAVCRGPVGSFSQGWYASGSCETDGKVIKYGKCAQGQEECAKEGEFVPVVPGAKECCPGLKKISCDKPDSNGNCMDELCAGASICAKCGNRICGLGENKCNCSEDCKGKCHKELNKEDCELTGGEYICAVGGTETICHCQCPCKTNDDCVRNRCGLGRSAKSDYPYWCIEHRDNCEDGKCVYTQKEYKNRTCGGIDGIQCVDACGDGVCKGSEAAWCPEDCKEGTEELSCDEKCKAKGYNAGICRMSCNSMEGEVDMGYLSNCNPPCPAGMSCAQVLYNCCCQGGEQCRDENYMCTTEDFPCCSGLKPVPLAHIKDGKCIILPCGDVCRPCGNGVCDGGENKCNCPEDCKEDLSFSADLNCDGNVNLTDTAILLSFWNKDPAGATSCQSPDINQDGKVNLADFSIIMSQWTS